MTTQPTLFDQPSPNVRAHRKSKREQVKEFFMLNLGVKVSTSWLHDKFGTAVRTRISELNRDSSCPVSILNHCEFKDGVEQSVYWSERRI